MVITTGIQDGNIVARQEIRVMAQDQDLMNLYLIGLDRFQRVKQEETLSYFQIAGIHGRPYVPYDGARGIGNFGGYCTHSSILFPPWHRPYLALFEQALGKHINDVANEYTDPAAKAKYQAAAKRFRVPYWDWALNADVPDFVSQQRQVTVDTPTGRQTIDNPLYEYKFRPMYSNFGDGLREEKTWEAWLSTKRWPTTNDGNAQSNAIQMERNLANNRYTLRDRTYNLLTQARTYASFSNDGFLGSAASPVAYDSLESIHGSIHGMTGRTGHMGVVDYAAFDPIFWLHHANVDRIFALWQALHPNEYVVPRQNDAGTFTTARGTVETENSPLAPFWRRQNVYWTAAEARDTRTFGYTYPELVEWSKLSPNQKNTRIRTDINLLYGRSARMAQIVPDIFQLKPQATTTNATNIATIAGRPPAPPAITANRPAANVGQAAQQPVAAPALTTAERIRKNFEEGARQARERAAAPVAKAAVAAKKTVAPAEDAEPEAPAETTSGAASEFTVTQTPASDDNRKHYNEWIANITVEKYAVKETFLVYIFLGDFEEDPNLWGEDPDLVGTHVVFANNLGTTGCEACRDAAEVHKLVTGTIPLTGALADKLGEDHDLEPESVIPYLTRELHWRVQGNDGHVVDRGQVPGLKVSVAHMRAAAPRELGEFPEWDEGEKAPQVTTGRPGGAGEDD